MAVFFVKVLYYFPRATVTKCNKPEWLKTEIDALTVLKAKKNNIKVSAGPSSP